MSNGAALQTNHWARCNHVSHGEPRWRLYFGCAMQIINDKDSILVDGIKLHACCCQLSSLSAESKQLYANKQRNLSKRSMFLRSLLKYFNNQTQAKIYQGKYRY